MSFWAGILKYSRLKAQMPRLNGHYMMILASYLVEIYLAVVNCQFLSGRIPGLSPSKRFSIGISD
jgi:hypothetical protein